MNERYIVKVLRGTPEHQYWEEFEHTLYPGENIISFLMNVQKEPITRQGAETTPIAWEQGCLEEVCGSCSMLINGKPRQSCTALIANLIKENGTTITLAPFTKFPLIRDLVVDRTSMFEALKKVKAWVAVDGSWDNQENGPKGAGGDQRQSGRLVANLSRSRRQGGHSSNGRRSVAVARQAFAP